jgi:hypothetical protein
MHLRGYWSFSCGIPACGLHTPGFLQNPYPYLPKPVPLGTGGKPMSIPSAPACLSFKGNDTRFVATEEADEGCAADQQDSRS